LYSESNGANVFCFPSSLPLLLPATTAVFGSYLSSLFSSNTVSPVRACQSWANLDRTPKDLYTTLFRDLSPTPFTQKKVYYRNFFGPRWKQSLDRSRLFVDNDHEKHPTAKPTSKTIAVFLPILFLGVYMFFIFWCALSPPLPLGVGNMTSKAPAIPRPPPS
jgi:hypothetical protein